MSIPMVTTNTSNVYWGTSLLGQFENATLMTTTATERVVESVRLKGLFRWSFDFYVQDRLGDPTDNRLHRIEGESYKPADVSIIVRDLKRDRLTTLVLQVSGWVMWKYGEDWPTLMASIRQTGQKEANYVLVSGGAGPRLIVPSNPALAQLL